MSGVDEVVRDIFNYIENNRDRYIELLKRLVSQPSVSATGEGIKECAGLVSEMLEEIGVRTDTYTDHGGNPVVFGEIKAEAHATLMFYNHYDVQPPEPVDGWSVTKPFEPIVKDGKIFGRGTADNKGNIAARIAAVEAVLNKLGEVPVNIKFLIEGEEEMGSPTLPKFVDLHSDLLFADGCIWEFGYRNPLGNPVIYLGTKGMLYVELEAVGAEAEIHSSWGAIVENPAWRLVQVLNTIRDKTGRIKIRGFYDGVQKPSPKALSLLRKIPPEDIDVEKLFGARLFKKKTPLRALLLEPACNICGIISGYTGKGGKTIIPPKAMAKLDFRLVPNQDPTDLTEKLKKHLEENGFQDITVRVIKGYPAARTEPDHPFVDAVAETAQQAYGVEPVIYPSSAASGPMYLIVNRLGIPCVSTGVSYFGSRTHAVDENIRVEDFLAGIKHMALLILRLHSYLR